MAKYICPKCAMEYERPGKCGMCNVKNRGLTHKAVLEHAQKRWSVSDT